VDVANGSAIGEPPSSSAPGSTRAALSRPEILNLFIGTTHVDLAAIHEAVRAGDAAAVARRAHGVAGAAAVLGAHEVLRLARELEHAAAIGDLETCSTLTSGLATAIESFVSGRVDAPELPST
jgi:HPt (histidine-containing phosphotransfer) domain-containing protein